MVLSGIITVLAFLLARANRAQKDTAHLSLAANNNDEERSGDRPRVAIVGGEHIGYGGWIRPVSIWKVQQPTSWQSFDRFQILMILVLLLQTQIDPTPRDSTLDTPVTRECFGNESKIGASLFGN